MDRNQQYQSNTDEIDVEVNNAETDIQHEDISSLPSRAEIHRKKRKRKKKRWKPKYPLIKLLALFFVLLPIVLYSSFTFFGNSNSLTGQKASGNNDGFETIDINNNDKKNTTLNIRDNNETNNTDNVQVEREDNPPEQQVGDKSVNEEKTNDESDVIIEPPKNESNENDNNQAKNDHLNQNSKNTVYHTVKANETLYRISMNYYESQTGVVIIKQANNLQSDEIYVGQVLKIPLNN